MKVLNLKKVSSMKRIVFSCFFLFPISLFSQNTIYEKEKSRIDSLVNNIDSNRDKLQIIINCGGEIINMYNKRIGSTDGEILLDEEENVVKIEESIVMENYSEYEFYYSENELVYLHFKRENHKKKEVKTLENCSVYILNNNITFVPAKQTPYCSLNYKKLIKQGNEMIQEQLEQSQK